MLSISDGGALARALDYPLDPPLRDLLLLRQKQLGGDLSGVRFVIYQPGDRPCTLEETLGWSIFQNRADGTWYGDPDYTPGFEWIEDHGFCFELVFEFTADMSHAILIENQPGVHREVLEFCRTYAMQSA